MSEAAHDGRRVHSYYFPKFLRSDHSPRLYIRLIIQFPNAPDFGPTVVQGTSLPHVLDAIRYIILREEPGLPFRFAWPRGSEIGLSTKIRGRVA